jgi:ferredoxin
MGLKEILVNNRCFKLVCGAGNEDPVEVEKLVAVYARAGANYFDLSARLEVVVAAKEGLARVVPKSDRKKYFFNVSVGMPGDPHVRKAVIAVQKCNSCTACVKVCNQKALKIVSGKCVVIKERCIGCGDCVKVCPVIAITFVTEKRDLQEILPPLIALGLDSLELHAVTDDEEGAFGQWQIINRLFKGPLSLCLDRSHLGDKQLIARINRFIEGRIPCNTILQADGAPMSGGDDRPNTTLQALATADVVQKAKLPVWLLISGGTNSKTARLARVFELPFNGVAIGSYARKIIRKYLEQDNFLTDKRTFETALRLCRALVSSTYKYMR